VTTAHLPASSPGRGSNRKAAEVTEGPSPGVGLARSPGVVRAMASEGRNRAGWTRPGGTEDRRATDGGRVAPGEWRGGRFGRRQEGGGMEGSGVCPAFFSHHPTRSAGRSPGRRRTAPPSPPGGGTIRETGRVCCRRRRRGSHCTGLGRGLSSRQGCGGPVRGARVLQGGHPGHRGASGDCARSRPNFGAGHTPCPAPSGGRVSPVITRGPGPAGRGRTLVRRPGSRRIAPAQPAPPAEHTPAGGGHRPPEHVRQCGLADTPFVRNGTDDRHGGFPPD
jgi:hypothetical protein